MSSLDFTFFQPGHNTLLHALTIHSQLGNSQLGVGAILLACALGYCAYTDVMCGRIIRNSVVGAIALASAATAPLIFTDVRAHFAWAAVAIVIVSVLYILHVFKEGDVKLFAALAFLFAQGTLVLLLASCAIIVVYGLPSALRSRALARKEGRKHGLTQVAAGPGIALAYPLTLLLAGVSSGDCLLLVIAELATFTVSILGADLMRRAEAKAE